MITRRRSILSAVLVTLVTLTAAAVPAAAASGPPPPRPALGPAEPNASYAGESACEPVARPGTQALRAMAMAHYRAGRDASMARPCTSGVSEHEEGRAWDWGLNTANPAERAIGDEFAAWLTGPDAQGEPGGNARRLGVMYVIWNRMTWKAYRAASGWTPYTGSNPHTDHVHVSLTWDGALKRTSWWTGVTVLPKAPAAPASAPSVLSSGRRLSASGTIVSPDRAHVLQMGADGTLGQYSDRRQVWTARSGLDAGARLVMQADGNAVLYGSDGLPRWWTGTAGNPGARLVVQSDGNVVVYASSGRPLWWNGTRVDELSTAPVRLSAEQTLRSGGGQVLVMQADGNLVEYDAAGRPVWWSGTAGNRGASLVLQEDGDLVIESADHRALWRTGSASGAKVSARLVLQGDGNLVLYHAGGMSDMPRWASRA